MATDPAALFRLALLATALAALPLGAWLLRSRGAPPRHRLAMLTGLTLFLTFDLIVFGVFTRLSDAGLGCPDWPGCYGEASPLAARAEIHAEQALRPDGPVTWGKAWIEMVHRYLAMAVGLLITVGALAAWRHRRVLPHSPAWATLTLGWVVLQGLFGRYTVTLKLYPAIVTLHLLGAMVLLALLAWQRASIDAGRARRLRPGRPALAVAALVALSVQVALGGWVSTNYAVLACQGFPTCNGQWWPPGDWTQGFTLLRELGRAGHGGFLSHEALVAIHWTHRLFALAAFSLLGWLAWRLWPEAAWRRHGALLTLLLLAQLATGLSNVVLQWPLVGALLHSAGAALMVALVVDVLARHRVARWG